jgi:hypothetical protein
MEGVRIQESREGEIMNSFYSRIGIQDRMKGENSSNPIQRLFINIQGPISYPQLLWILNESCVKEDTSLPPVLKSVLIKRKGNHGRAPAD